MKKFLLSFLSFLIFTASASAQDFTAKVNRQEIPQGEILMLTLEYQGGQTSQKPGLEVLNRNFNIFSISQAVQHNYINGKSSQSQQWDVALMPKETGKILIPSVALGSLSSNPIEINVIPASPQNTAAGKEMPRYAIEAKINNPNPYVQQETDLTVTIYDAGGLNGEAPGFIDDGKNDWNIIPLGEPTLESKVINGRTIRVITYKYALFPQRSGQLTVPTVQFNGYYLTGGRGSNNDPLRQILGVDLADMGFNFADIYATRNPVLLTTEPISVNVKPAAPASAGKWWLPAQKVELYSEWQPTPPLFKAGEAVTRNIYLKAWGVTDKQLPDLNFAPAPGMKLYPEKPVSTNKMENGVITATSKIANVYIPSKPGKSLIPEISVDWFNVKTGKMETASLPAMEITVQPGNAEITISEEPASEAIQKNMKENPPTEETHPKKSIKLPENTSEAQGYLWIAVAFLAGIFVSYLLFSRGRTDENGENKNCRDFANDVLRFARHKDFRALRDSLLFWARKKYGDESISNFREIAQYTQNPEFSKVLNTLSENMYATESNEWDSDKFITLFKKVNKAKYSPQRNNKPLPDLYE